LQQAKDEFQIAEQNTVDLTQKSSDLSSALSTLQSRLNSMSSANAPRTSATQQLEAEVN